jgi:dihydrofolate synthase/folylpolyglutamate synthase
MITSVLNEAGFKVGLFTSPHLVRFNERIRIGNGEITDREVASVAEKVRATMEKTKACRDATFFEVTTAMAFEYFKEKNVDLAVLEVGMGGRLDATNVVTPLVSVITNIGYDHERFLGKDVLGKDVGGIAVEKAGVIKEGSPVVCGVEGARTVGLIQGITRKRRAEFYLLGRDFGFVPSGRMFDYWADKNSFKGLGLNLRGTSLAKRF